MATDLPPGGEWWPAPECTVVHPYGAEGWRPGADGVHEHYVTVSLNVGFSLTDAEDDDAMRSRTLTTMPDTPRGFAHRIEGGHWLAFDDERHIIGCHCGFPADPNDAGYGDSVLDHFEQVVRTEEQQRIDDYKHLLGSIWLYIPWHYVTKQLTTEQKELFADAVDWASKDQHDGLEVWTPVATRWWND